MNIEQAMVAIQVIADAVADAEAAGEDQVDLVKSLQELDHQAREDLQEAIERLAETIPSSDTQ